MYLGDVPIEVIEEHCDPDTIKDVLQVERLMTNAQKELLAMISVRSQNQLSSPLNGLLPTAFLSRFMPFLKLHGELQVELKCLV